MYLFRIGMTHDQMLDIFSPGDTGGVQTPFIVVFTGLHRARMRDTLHIAQETWP